jgi:hypothetical protein
LSHDDRKVCNPFEKASSDVKVPIALAPRSHEFDNIDFQIALEMQIIDHDHHLLGFVLGCECLLPFGNILFFDNLPESIE